MSAQAVQDWIRKTVASNDVVIFMKGTAQFPQCGFSARAVQLLKAAGATELQSAGVHDGGTVNRLIGP